jgi:hypothetical protein
MSEEVKVMNAEESPESKERPSCHWGTGTTDNPVIRKNLCEIILGFERDNPTHLDKYPRRAWEVTVSEEDARAMERSEEMVCYFESCNKLTMEERLVVPGFRLPKLLYGVTLKVDPYRKPGRAEIRNGGWMNQINLA